jgi:hypothetical protein
MRSFEIPNNNFQIPNKPQIPISNDPRDFVLNLGDWDLFGVWCLPVGRGFGASSYAMLRPLGAMLI